MTIALGLQPKQGLVKAQVERVTFHAPRSVGGCEEMNLHIPKWSWSVNGLPNFQKTIVWVKTHWIE